MEPGIIITNNNFTLTVSGADPETEEEFNYHWSDSTNEFAPATSSDFDDDGDVDGDDFLTWQRGVGTVSGATRAGGNANPAEDGDVDADDLAVWAEQFGTADATAATTAVPEPGGIYSLLVAAISLGGYFMARGLATHRATPGPLRH